MKTLSLTAAAQIRNLRSWVNAHGTKGRFFETAAEQDDFKKQLRFREGRLDEEARNAWFNWRRDEVTDALNVTTEVLTDDEVTVREKGGRFFFFVNGAKHDHDISSDPSITSPERLKAHVASVKAQARDGELVQGDFTAVELQEALKGAKDEVREDGHVFSGEWQIVGINADGDRTEESNGSGGAFAERPSKKLIEKLFAADLEAVSLSFYSELYWLDKELPLIERFEHREPVGNGACVTIRRASKKK